MILFCDSSTSTLRLKLIDGKFEVEREWDVGRSLARDLLKLVQQVVSERQKELQDIKAIIVFRGPGSYTGLRIGLTVMNTIARDIKIPILGTTGPEWDATGLTRLQNHEDDKLVLPEYGGDANITKPRK